MEEIHRKIRKWYRKYGRRELPWRRTDDPYAIYVSEVMLQQTQVKTVLERYYHPFLERFPTLESLADAPLDEVLKLWEGLGYYNRAKNLHRTATLVEKLPDTADALTTLPGIGKNTAHALLVFAFRQPVPVLEANVKRILCRLYRLKAPTEKRLWEIAYRLLDRENAFDYNQAMMDIGATLCKPRDPECHRCPLEEVCRGRAHPLRYPAKKKRIQRLRQQHIVLWVCEGKLSLVRRTGNFLHGLWGFPETDTPPHASEYIGDVTHTYSHFKLHGSVYLHHESKCTQEHYFTPEEIRGLALSKVDEKILKLCLKHL